MDPCRCCAESSPCPALPESSGLILDRWIGSRVLPVDLRGYQPWIDWNLDQYKDAVWLWSVVFYSTGDVPAGTRLCLAQNRRSFNQYVAPAGKSIDNELQRITFSGTITAGTFTIRVHRADKPNLPPWIETTAPLGWNTNATLIRQALEALPSIGAGNVIVLGGPCPNAPFTVEFTGDLAGVNLDELVIDVASLSPSPSVTVETPVDGSTVNGFAPIFEPLNVGTVWQGRMRNAYGNATSRAINRAQNELIDTNEDGNGDSWTSCGAGIGANSLGHEIELPNASVATQLVRAEWLIDDNGNGALHVTAGLNVECAIKVQCLGCRYSAEFSLWGGYEPSLITRKQVVTTGVTGSGGSVCPTYAVVYSNRGYLGWYKFGPDGVDGHIRNEAFGLLDVVTPRTPPCAPDVVALGDGSWSEEHNDFGDARVTQVPPPCPNAPTLEFARDNPTMDLDRLRAIYGESFSYWGGWLNRTDPITTRFDEYDLTDVKVLFLGGFSAGSVNGAVPSVGATFDRYPSPAGTLDLVNAPFAPGALEALKQWLSLGERVLVLDGGWFPQQFYSSLGLATTVEPFGETIPAGSSVTANTLNFKQWGPELPDWSQPNFATVYFDPLRCDPLPHAFTTDVTDGFVTDPTYTGEGAAGDPAGTGHVTHGLLTVSQKWGSDLETKPIGGLRSYTTAVPLLVPGPDAVVIGQVRGRVPVAPYHSGTSFVTVAVDYPGVVAETWKASFRLRFTHNGTTETTAVLSSTASASAVQTALAALTNLGPTPTVAGGPLPAEITIWFDTPLTQLQDVAQLEVVDSGHWTVTTQREGVIGTMDAIEVLSQVHKPSRIIVSQVNELVSPTAWGTGITTARPFDGYAAAVPGAPNTWQDLYGEYHAQLNTYDLFYRWGRGLSSIAARVFLENLLTRRTEF